MYERLVEFEHFNLASVDDVVHCRAAQNDHLATNDNHYGARTTTGQAAALIGYLQQFFTTGCQSACSNSPSRQRVHGDTGSSNPDWARWIVNDPTFGSRTGMPKVREAHG